MTKRRLPSLSVIVLLAISSGVRVTSKQGAGFPTQESTSGLAESANPEKSPVYKAGVGNGAANGAEVSSLAKCGAGGAKKRNESKNERRKLEHF